MTVDPASPLRADHQGTTYFFCNPGCRTKFQAEPGRIPGQDRAPEPMGTPRRSTPARCTPRRARRARRLPDLRHGARAARRSTLDDDGRTPSCRHDAALLVGRRARRCRCSLLAMGGDAPGAPVARADRAARCVDWIELALATPVVLWAGWPFFVRAWQSVVNRSLNMFTLIGARRRRRRTSTASSRRSRPGCFRPAFRIDTARVGAVFRSGRGDQRRWCCSARCSSSARAAAPARAIRALLGLAPKTARRVRDDGASRTCRSTTCRSATGCACGRARRFRSTASCSRARARSTNRW